MKKLLLGLLCFICMPFIQVSATDSPLWNHEITLGYGYAREIFYPVHNSGFVSSVMLHRFGMWGQTLNFSLNGIHIKHNKPNNSFFTEILHNSIFFCFFSYFLFIANLHTR